MARSPRRTGWRKNGSILMPRGQELAIDSFSRDSLAKDSHKVYSFLSWLFPMMHVKFSGVDIIFNRKIVDRVREVFMLKLWDIEMLGFCHEFYDESMCLQDCERLSFSFFGMRLTVSPSAEHPFSCQYDKKILAVALSMALFVLLNMWATLVIPPVVVTVVPIWGNPISELSLASMMLSYRAFVACIEILTAVESAFFAYTDGVRGQKNWALFCKNVLNYRIWLQVLIFPAAIFNYDILLLVMVVTGVISLLDALFSEEAIFMFHWSVARFSVVLLGFSRAVNTACDAQFSLLTIDLKLFTPDYYKTSTCGEFVSSYASHMKPYGMGMDQDEKEPDGVLRSPSP